MAGSLKATTAQWHETLRQSGEKSKIPMPSCVKHPPAVQRRHRGNTRRPLAERTSNSPCVDLKVSDTKKEQFKKDSPKRPSPRPLGRDCVPIGLTIISSHKKCKQVSENKFQQSVFPTLAQSIKPQKSKSNTWGLKTGISKGEHWLTRSSEEEPLSLLWRRRMEEAQAQLVKRCIRQDF